ncbi:D-2-hydroxyacid dehydrogenase [Virgibacillus profundi]|uniref:D-2-hydroxyacid dehydrogenase n=1 Tax=Virgibacillus profundi TaxID=2024555 RepID=A0A2A2I9Z9_9BACI|nr:D-2-hydroxyacid dehydrogenase [Virgibacillus profundi]PAV28156.1 D-2-hydroxyacid dehydrogenase [Virgibacillus profundi]PXY52461.1 D-2-hydroxyacid dehydrogenase [Virgibacillus profundi]
MILFSAKVSEKHREKLIENNTDQTFIFCNNMDEAKEHLNDAEILVTYGSDLTAELVKHAAKLKWIMVMSAGLEQMPFKEIEEKNIVVTNARGIHKIPMAEYAIGMLLQVYRQAKALYKSEAEQHWDRSVHMQEITGKTMLILGTGSIGQEVARLAKAFQIKTIGVSRSGREVAYFDETHKVNDMKNVLPYADFVVSVLPSTNETSGLFTYEHFQLLPGHAVFLNMGRGDLVRSEDLLKAIQEKEISHAILDVFEEEPLPKEHIFWQEENITITPHLSGMSKQYTTRALEIFTENLDVYVQGKAEMMNKIDLSRGY